MKREPKKVTARQLVRQMFEAAERQGGCRCMDVWNLVTALRGPDSENDNEKERYTWPVRFACVPKRILRQIFNRNFVDRMKPNAISTKAKFAVRSYGAGAGNVPHFLRHARRALGVLSRRGARGKGKQ